MVFVEKRIVSAAVGKTEIYQFLKHSKCFLR